MGKRMGDQAKRESDRAAAPIASSTRFEKWNLQNPNRNCDLLCFGRRGGLSHRRGRRRASERAIESIKVALYQFVAGILRGATFNSAGSRGRILKTRFRTQLLHAIHSGARRSHIVTTVLRGLARFSRVQAVMPSNFLIKISVAGLAGNSLQAFGKIKVAL